MWARLWKTEEVKSDDNVSIENKVIINLWLPKIKGKPSTAFALLKAHAKERIREGDDTCIGHSALETTQQYASWWPAPNHPDHVGVFNVVPALNSTYADDCKSERQDPNLRVCLYSLDVVTLEENFKSIEEDPGYGYVLAGDKKITRLFNEQRGQSCCGLAYELLVAGGILKLCSAYQDILSKWVAVTPENLAELVQHAKQRELDLYPQTRAFLGVPNEYLPEIEEQRQRCIIS